MCKYGVRPEELRIYLHYQPSYYHLHMHFLHIKCDAGAGMAAGKAHLLDDVIGEDPLAHTKSGACLYALL